MAITVTALQPKGAGFAVNGYSADASGCEVLVAAPAAGVSIYLHSVSVVCSSGITVTIGEGETASAPDAVIVGPLTFLAIVPTQVTYNFREPIKLTAAKALVVDSSGAGAVVVVAQGTIE